jgi:hypothetical protein
VRESRLSGLQRQLLLWAGVLAVALSLLAMHQMSANHTAADPRPPASVHLHADSGPAGGHVDTAARSGAADHTHLQIAGSTDHHPAPAGDTCPGCREHQAMALTCLVALTLLAVGWLLRRPVRWPGLLARHLARAALNDRRNRWRRPPLNLMELSISRT